MSFSHALTQAFVWLLCLSTVAFAGENLSWKEVQLTAASGVTQPHDSKDHTYYFKGTLVITHSSKSSGFSFKKGFYTKQSSKLKETIFVDAYAEWDRSKNLVKEKVSMTFAGGKKAHLSSEFKFSKDPWLHHSSNTGVVMDVKLSSEKSPIRDYVYLIKKHRQPLTRDLVNHQLAVSLSKKANKKPVAPPPPPKISSNKGKKPGLKTAPNFGKRPGLKATKNLGKTPGLKSTQNPGKTPGLKATKPTLKSAKPTLTHQFSGKWNSNIGVVNFTQTKEKIRGQIHFDNGAVGVINGVIKGSKIEFKWGFAGFELGDGVLNHIKKNHLSGFYRDKNNITKKFVLEKTGNK